MAATKRSTVEEAMLLPTPLKIGVLVVTFLSDLLRTLELEVAIAAVVVIVSVLILALSWWVASSWIRALGLSLLMIGMIIPFVLAPVHLPSPVIPVFPKSNPPRFPKAGFITRDNLITTGGDGWFREKAAPNRVAILRGVNFGASTKIPSANDASHIKSDDFYSKHRDVSFVSRPCPLTEADEHFSRLASWGFNTLRLLITWEAVEHKGPGIYDQEYLAYLKALCKKAAKHGISVFIDPHQDVWSRFTGGDGAPGWTLEKVGFKLGPELYETGATLTHQEHGDPFPRMSWPTNYARLACSTMFTLFFAGDDFAPRTRIDQKSAQEFLQGHYIQAMREVAKALKDEKNVLGFDSLNEPSNGYVGLEDVRLSLFPVPLAYHMSAYDGMLLGAGFSRRIDFFPYPFVFNRTILMNPSKISVWQSEAHDVWRNNGVWDVGTDGQPRLLRPDHFAVRKNSSFVETYMLPFFVKLTEALRAEAPDMIMFAEPHIEPRKMVHHHAPVSKMADALGSDQGLAWVPHFYDGATLSLKSFRGWFALDAEASSVAVTDYFARKVFARASAGLRKAGDGLPVLIGETGVPMDMTNSFVTGDYTAQALSLNRVLTAMEKQFLSWTLWTYTPDNTNERGDLWNGEDLSLWSKDQVTDENDLNSGGRALISAIRPFPMKAAGTPVETSFEPLTDLKRFFLKLRLSVSTGSVSTLETVLFIPKIQYPNGIEWRVGGRGSSVLKPLEDENDQGYVWKHDVSSGATSVDKNLEYVDQWIEIEAKM